MPISLSEATGATSTSVGDMREFRASFVSPVGTPSTLMLTLGGQGLSQIGSVTTKAGSDTQTITVSAKWTSAGEASGRIGVRRWTGSFILLGNPEPFNRTATSCSCRMTIPSSENGGRLPDEEFTYPKSSLTWDASLVHTKSLRIPTIQARIDPVT